MITLSGGFIFILILLRKSMHVDTFCADFDTPGNLSLHEIWPYTQFYLPTTYNMINTFIMNMYKLQREKKSSLTPTQ
jgi:hypothetical protein